MVLLVLGVVVLVVGYSLALAIESDGTGAQIVIGILLVLLILGWAIISVVRRARQSKVAGAPGEENADPKVSPRDRPPLLSLSRRDLRVGLAISVVVLLCGGAIWWIASLILR